MPNRHDLDRVAPDNPVYIKAPWGYWPNRLPLRSVANSRALTAAGVDKFTVSPSSLVTIERDPVTSELTGVFLEQANQPIVEFTLMACAPNFTLAQRTRGLIHAMRSYNSVGTTSVFEGHGISQDVLGAYQSVRNSGQMTLRAHLCSSKLALCVGGGCPPNAEQLVAMACPARPRRRLAPNRRYLYGNH